MCFLTNIFFICWNRTLKFTQFICDTLEEYFNMYFRSYLFWKSHNLPYNSRAHLLLSGEKFQIFYKWELLVISPYLELRCRVINKFLQEIF